ncbi:alpha/beta fold hydrolase [Chelatococcus asaccharovorans]|uniref:Pimeloyl-ACP methyl ester carboxylesterase n=1 Tax=Chelatococcus asaccharovorans TaxID=28210 RepID=A0A2V3UKZ6_9HYPH|nr:alpha/beta hydrolase [Chelatococcus asaccharovorans]MBS7705483.1 alpha/beta hydrolase [Chelatococcus asaccharovorans]PXW60112.1 pimeloyl-ACP methyl ester carboxylesterase [Chelatococcus asaccharovorans]
MHDAYQDGWVEINGLRLHYTEWGSPAKPTLLMLHGLNVTCHTWDPFARELQKNYHVICPDLRGHGDSDWAREGYRVRQFANDIHRFIDALGTGPVHLVGHSNGVRVGIAVAGERPEMVRTLALSDAGPQNSPSGAVAMRDFLTATTNLRGFRDEADARAFYLGHHPEWQPEFINLHVKYQLRKNWAGKLVPKQDPDLQWITGSISLPDVTYLWSMAKRLSMPTLVMAGRTSNVIDAEVVDKMLATMPNAKATWFDSGHYFLRERPDEFLSCLSAFLSEHEAA